MQQAKPQLSASIYQQRQQAESQSSNNGYQQMQQSKPQSSGSSYQQMQQVKPQPSPSIYQAMQQSSSNSYQQSAPTSYQPQPKPAPAPSYVASMPVYMSMAKPSGQPANQMTSYTSNSASAQPMTYSALMGYQMAPAPSPSSSMSHFYSQMMDSYEEEEPSYDQLMCAEMPGKSTLSCRLSSS
jgi:hypothetical protein